MHSAAVVCSFLFVLCYWICHFTCTALLYSQVLVYDDESLNLVNELGMKNLVAVRAPAPGKAATTEANDGITVAPQLELTTEVTESSSEVDVYVIPESNEGSLLWG